LLEAAKGHRIEWRWVPGHSGDPMNDRVDALATKARDYGPPPPSNPLPQGEGE
jgi:ribonuclease HI